MSKIGRFEKNLVQLTNDDFLPLLVTSKIAFLLDPKLVGTNLIFIYFAYNAINYYSQIN